MSATIPIARAMSTGGLTRQRDPAWISPYTIAPKPIVTNRVPHQSSLPDASSSRLSGTRQNKTPSTTAARGTLIKKTQRQEAYWTKTPPSTGPTNEVIEEKPDQQPITRPPSSLLNHPLMITTLPAT